MTGSARPLSPGIRRPAPRARPFRLLVTGFGPFPGVPENPTETLVRRLAGRWARRPPAANLAPSFAVLPTEWETLAALPALLDRHRPDAVLLTGVASRALRTRLERTARNRMGGRVPDAAGRSPPSARRVAAGRMVTPLAPRLPALRAGVLREHGLVVVSDDAGDYLCNAAYLETLALLAARIGPARALFVHLPPLSRGRGRRLDDHERALARLARALARGA